jgi:rhodanese-related sulfurtransferase/peroxiredoxin
MNARRAVPTVAGLFLVGWALALGWAAVGQPKPAVGEKAVNFTLPTLEGKKLTLDKLKGRSGAVLVFFATWCPPCMAEVPHIKQFAEKFKNSDVVVFGVTDQTADIARRFAETKEINYRILMDSDTKVAQSYNVNFIPHVVGIDSEGIVRYRGSALPDEDEAFVKELTAPLATQKQLEKSKSPDKTGAKTPVSYVPLDDLRKWMADGKDLVVVDVLDKDSYRDAHIKGAINIPLSDIEKRAGGARQLDKTRRTVLYCGGPKCRMSTVAAAQLAQGGFTNVHSYKGGLAEWKKAGLPIESGEK